MAPARVLILQNLIPHYRVSLYNQLAERYSVTILHSGAPAARREDRFEEIVTRSIAVGPFEIQAAVLSQVRSGRFDVVVAMFDLRWIVNVAAALINPGVRFLYWGHRYGPRPWVNRLRDRMMKHADGVILYSPGPIQGVLDAGIPASSVYVAHNTLDIPNASDGSRRPKDRFLFVGRLQPRKKVDQLIVAFAEAADRLPGGVELSIVGEGPAEPFLRETCHRLGVSDRVHFHGELLDPTQLRGLFHRSFAYVSPGPVGLSVLHSFAYGLPVITALEAAHGPEFENLVPGVNSLLFASGEELTELLVHTAQNPAEARQMGRNGYDLYTRERTIDAMVDVFTEAIEGNGSVSASRQD